VAKSNRYLRGRIQSGYKQASTFSSRALAEDAISGAILLRGWRVAQFLKSKRTVDVFEQEFDRAVGRVMLKDGTIRFTRRIRVVLQKDPRHPLGYFIKTSYPIL